MSILFVCSDQASGGVITTSNNNSADSVPLLSPEFHEPVTDVTLPCISSTPSENEVPFNAQDELDDEDLPPLIIEVEERIAEKPFPSNRVICDIGHVISQTRKLEKHTYSCKFGGKMILNRTVQKGLYFIYTFICNKPRCKCTAKITTDKETTTLNQLAVLGALSTGNGYSLEEQKFSLMNMSYMSEKTYSSCEAIAGRVVHSLKRNLWLKQLKKKKN